MASLLVLLTMRARILGAAPVHRERVLLECESAFLGNEFLAAFDLGVEEFLDASAIQAHQVVVVMSLVELENGLAGFKVAARL